MNNIFKPVSRQIGRTRRLFILCQGAQHAIVVIKKALQLLDIGLDAQQAVLGNKLHIGRRFAVL